MEGVIIMIDASFPSCSRAWQKMPGEENPCPFAQPESCRGNLPVVLIDSIEVLRKDNGN
jgi:hypothetical protein